MYIQEGVRITDQLEDVPSLVSGLRASGVDVGFDTETTGLDPLHSKLVALQFKPKGKKATIIDVRHMSPEDLCLLGTLLEPLFDGEVELVGHNLKFDLSMSLVHLGLAGHRVYDTLLAEQIVWGLGESSAIKKKIKFGMDALAERYQLEVTKEERAWFPELDQRQEEWDAPFPDEQVRYMRQDVAVVHKIKEAQQPLIKEYKLAEVIDLEMRAIFALVGVEVWGVQINREGWFKVIDEVTELAQGIERTLHLGVEGKYEGLDVHVLNVRHQNYLAKWKPYEEWMGARDDFMAGRKAVWETVPKGDVLYIPERPGEPFSNWSEYKKFSLEWFYKTHGKLTKPPENKSPVNLGSWMQLRDAFNDLGIPVKGSSEEELIPYLGVHPLVQVAIDYGHAMQLVKMYGSEKSKGKKGKTFAEMLDEFGRLRASYKQIGADTGRMSSYKPNFQQIPDKGVGAELRKNVIAAEGYTFVVADFSNIELRIAAEVSGDKFLLDAFASGMDLHAYTAIVMFGLTLPEGANPKEWTDGHDAVVGGKTIPNVSYRVIAKTINYMLLYGAGVKSLATKLQVSEQDAKAMLKIYRETFATCIAWLDTQKKRLEQAKKAGEERVFAETRAGRRRWFDVPHPPKYPAAKGERLTVAATEQYEADMDAFRKQMGTVKRALANTPIQGLSADITKLAAALWYELVGYNPFVRLVAIIHDEFIIEATPEYAERAARWLESVMYQAMKTYLQVVDLGKVKAVQTPYWMH